MRACPGGRMVEGRGRGGGQLGEKETYLIISTSKKKVMTSRVDGY